MPSVCFYFQVHQPMRIKKYRIFDIGGNSDYFNDNSQNNLNNKKMLEKIANKCYLPANRILLKLLKKFSEFTVSFSLSGILLEQLELYCPDALESFQDLIKTGRVELLSETYYHSLSFLYSQEEFETQITLHRKKIKKLFSKEPAIFRNTELIYSNAIAKKIEEMGFKGILAEGAERILAGQSPNFIYEPKETKKIKLLLKNYKLSDDVAFRFSSRKWEEYPLTASKFARWISALNGNGEVVNLFMDYETFGEHHWEDTGIFNFLRALPSEILKDPSNDFITPSQAIEHFKPANSLDVPDFVSWADIERDLSAWRSNSIQYDALEKLYALERAVLKTQNAKLIKDWRKLQTSDHFYYMCTKWFADGDVHKYFNPYESPYEAFIAFMNVLQDLKLRIQNHTRGAFSSDDTPSVRTAIMSERARKSSNNL